MAAATRRELILYATPLGELAAQCDRYFDAARQLGPTAAQTYPPHCTLTGFFRREPERADELVAELGATLGGVAVPDDAVEVVQLRCAEAWIGLELRSAWLEATTHRLLGSTAVAEGDDPIRFKSDLHLSLAYDVDVRRRDLTPYAALARATVDASAPVAWEIGLWERRERSWTRLT